MNTNQSQPASAPLHRLVGQFATFNGKLRDNIRTQCEIKWPESQDKVGTLAVAIARVTGRSTGLHSIANVIKAFDTGLCSLLLLRDIAKALDVSMDDLLPNAKLTGPAN
jgi:hypothetical protein